MQVIVDILVEQRRVDHHADANKAVVKHVEELSED